MAFEIVDGMTGTKHISSDDLAALNTATVGKASCVLDYGNDFSLTMASANAATLGTGVGMVGGKRFWNQAPVQLTVESGAQGQKRNDLVVARYSKTTEGIESIEPVVIKGTPTTGTAADPAVTTNDLKLWRIPINGITVGTPAKLFSPVTPLATLGDSVSQVKVGSWTSNVYGCSVTMIVSYVPIIRSLVIETKGSGYMSSNASVNYSKDMFTLPSKYRPSGDRSVCLYSNAQFGLSVMVRANAEGPVTITVASTGAMNGYGWPPAKIFVPL